MINKVILVGNLGKDPEIKNVGNTRLANFSLATTKSVKKNDEWEKKTVWHNIVAWGKQVDFIEKYISKGSLVYIEGEIETRSYDDKDGNKKYVTEINAYEVKSLAHKKENDLPMP